MLTTHLTPRARRFEIDTRRAVIAAIIFSAGQRTIPLLTTSEQAEIGMLEIQLDQLEREHNRWLDSLTVRETPQGE